MLGAPRPAAVSQGVSGLWVQSGAMKGRAVRPRGPEGSLGMAGGIGGVGVGGVFVAVAVAVEVAVEAEAAAVAGWGAGVGDLVGRRRQRAEGGVGGGGL